MTSMVTWTEDKTERQCGMVAQVPVPWRRKVEHGDVSVFVHSRSGEAWKKIMEASGEAEGTYIPARTRSKADET